MARYTGPSWKIARRLKFSISETGKELGKRPYAPGQHGHPGQRLHGCAQRACESRSHQNLWRQQLESGADCRGERLRGSEGTAAHEHLLQQSFFGGYGGAGLGRMHPCP